MAYTDEEIREAYLDDMRKFCPRTKKQGVWVNTVRKGGKVPFSLHKEKPNEK